MKVINADHVPAPLFEQIREILPGAENLWQLMNWTKTRPKQYFDPQIVAEVIVQDEFTHDVVIPFHDVFLVFDTT
jgi:hypothetical protein